ncbi:carbohydrate-binding module family 32 [Amniculicola lignicola CBS 123094]|uniref:Carbohydrate-binding module family 32 n=1 Tax=Amniculicola lignicola CBS 123094 TaxID=1392246 RepID=A0A6A5WMB5_9PLEO|nr:carbohydrate-binding module family 32 [Amniculicola lignicola CBS 123094]
MPKSHVSDNNLLVFDDLEKTQDIPLYISPPSNRRWIKDNISFILKVVVLAFLTILLTSGRTIIQNVTLGYKAILPSGESHDHTLCSQEFVIDTPAYIAAAPEGAKELRPKDWNVECSSSIAGHGCSLAYDPEGNRTYWQSSSDPPPGGHSVIIDLKRLYNVQSLGVMPSKTFSDGGAVYKHRVDVSANKEDWTTVAMGTWRDYYAENYATFEPRPAQWVRLTVIESAKKAKYVAVSDINIFYVDSIPASVSNGGRWNITLDFPIVPVTAFVNPLNHEVTVQSAYMADGFDCCVNSKSTYSATWNPKTGIITEEVISDTAHDMFCPGTSFDEQGQLFVTGGSSPYGFSIFNPKSGKWSTPIDKTKNQPSKFNIPRGYAGQTFLPNGKTFMIGGTWGAAGEGEKDGEVYDPATGAWEKLDDVKGNLIKMDPSVTCQDPNNRKCNVTEWQQHHPWLFAWKDGSIFHAGPSKKLHWFYTLPANRGGAKDAGVRLDDGDAVCGVTSMYDAEAGLLLTAGGAPNYHYWLDTGRQGPNDLHRKEATNNAFEIKLGTHGELVKTTKLKPMKYKRIFASGVVLPNGETLVAGGQLQGEPFWEPTWQPVPEIYSPESKSWREVARHSTPRVYHSWALLLPNATVLVGGGGLDRRRPETNRYDAQIYQPPYLFAADGVTRVKQPAIKNIDRNSYQTGENITIMTDVSVDGASLVRYSAATHALNNDMRRIRLALQPVNELEKKYTVKIPKDPGVTLPGYWMLFVLANGVPSHAETVQILASR